MKTLQNNNSKVSADRKSQALAISFSMLLLLSVSAISLSFLNSSQSSHNAIAINLAGKQRMHTQRIEKDLLKLSYTEKIRTDSSSTLQDLSHSHSLFDRTLTVLASGQFTDQNGNGFFVSSTQSIKSIELVRQANNIWAPMREALQPVITSSPELSNADLKNALSIVMQNNERLMQLMDSLTSEIESAAHDRSEQLKAAEALAIGLVIVNFGFVLFYFRRQLSLLEERRLLSMRVMDNASAAIIVINQKGTIELCNHATESMFGYDTGRLIGEDFKILLDEPYVGKYGRRANGERFELDINLNEIPVPDHKIFVVSMYDMTEQKLKEEKLNDLAYHDPLTGLPNRLLFMDRLVQALARAHRNKEWVAILFIDLDRFKQVNDTLGHATGDLLLESVAARLVKCLREGDTLARLGGDEFTMIIDANDINSCSIISQKILSALNRKFYLNGNHIQISGSIGFSLYPDDSSDIQELIHFADAAMYRSKSKGGNTCSKYSETHADPESIPA